MVQYGKTRIERQRTAVGSIAKELGVSRGSVSLWVRDVVLTDEQKLDLENRMGKCHLEGSLANKEKALKKRQEWQNQGKSEAKEGKLLHAIGCMLYWGEGSKSRNVVGFVNSDKDMMILFIRFLTEVMCVQQQDITLKINCYIDEIEDIQRIEDFWLASTGLPKACLRKTMVNRRPISSKHKGHNRRSENGTCSATVCRTDIVQRIFGAIQEYASCDKKEWIR